ncbi:Conserved putative membrane protein [Amycolatopsis japonica]|uniref:Conserved putative membrane protein n=1 Tax=Amycolatopsis japonica TaxID=208439 RepID=A0A075UGS4_9PSEU|nr:lipase chaperone [Amycolatopsis japonica]AIG73157.1 Conserved putative membrane protein [Amycolatopsis japonica]
MTDLETLRSALREPPAEGFAEPDLGAIMTKGRRIRRRRRLATGAGGVAAAVVTVLVIVGAVALREPAQQPLPPAASAPVASAPAPAPVSPSITAAPSDAPFGEVIPLGYKGEGGRELVIYASEIDEPSMPDVRFGLQVAYRTGAGEYEALLAANEFKGSDRSFGFHAVDGGDVIRGTFVPVFGYFSGPAVRVTSTVRGKPVEAKVIPWSEDPSVVIFWFSPGQVESPYVLTPLVAYDAKGQRLTK